MESANFGPCRVLGAAVVRRQCTPTLKGNRRWVEHVQCGIRAITNYERLAGIAELVSELRIQWSRVVPWKRFAIGDRADETPPRTGRRRGRPKMLSRPYLAIRAMLANTRPSYSSRRPPRSDDLHRRKRVGVGHVQGSTASPANCAAPEHRRSQPPRRCAARHLAPWGALRLIPAWTVPTGW